MEGSMENGKHVCGERKTHLHGFQGMLGAVIKRIKCAGGSVLLCFFFKKKRSTKCARGGALSRSQQQQQQCKQSILITATEALAHADGMCAPVGGAGRNGPYMEGRRTGGRKGWNGLSV